MSTAGQEWHLEIYEDIYANQNVQFINSPTPRSHNSCFKLVSRSKQTMQEKLKKCDNVLSTAGQECRLEIYEDIYANQNV